MSAPQSSFRSKPFLLSQDVSDRAHLVESNRAGHPKGRVSSVFQLVNHSNADSNAPAVNMADHTTMGSYNYSNAVPRSFNNFRFPRIEVDNGTNRCSYQEFSNGERRYSLESLMRAAQKIENDQTYPVRNIGGFEAVSNIEINDLYTLKKTILEKTIESCITEIRKLPTIDNNHAMQQHSPALISDKLNMGSMNHMYDSVDNAKTLIQDLIQMKTLKTFRSDHYTLPPNFTHRHSVPHVSSEGFHNLPKPMLPSIETLTNQVGFAQHPLQHGQVPLRQNSYVATPLSVSVSPLRGSSHYGMNNNFHGTNYVTTSNNNMPTFKPLRTAPNHTYKLNSIKKVHKVAKNTNVGGNNYAKSHSTVRLTQNNISPFPQKSLSSIPSSGKPMMLSVSSPPSAATTDASVSTPKTSMPNASNDAIAQVSAPAAETKASPLGMKTPSQSQRPRSEPSTRNSVVQELAIAEILRKNSLGDIMTCVHCQEQDTPEWRRGPYGNRTLCNACGLFYRKLNKKFGTKEANLIMRYRQVNCPTDRRVPTSIMEVPPDVLESFNNDPNLDKDYNTVKNC